MNTTGNSSPLAACRVRSETRSARASRNIASVVSAAASCRRTRSLPHDCAEALERDRRAVHGIAVLCQPFGGGAQFIEKRRCLAAVAEFPQQRLDRRFVRERSM